MEFYAKGYIEWPRWFMLYYWPDMSDGERVLFQTFLSFAKWRGKERGWCLHPDSDIAAINRWGRTKHMKYKGLLRKRGLITTHKGKRGIFIPLYDEIVDYKTIEARNKGVRKEEQVGTNLSAQTNMCCSHKQTGSVRADEQVVSKSPEKSSDLQPPKNLRMFKNKRQKAKDGHNFKSSKDLSLLIQQQRYLEHIEHVWAKHWPDYPMIQRREIDLLLAEPLAEALEADRKVEFVCEAIRQLDLRRKETGDDPANPVAVIYAGLYRDSQWLRLRTRDALSEERETQIKEGHRGDDIDSKMLLGNILSGLKERGLR
jgi:hypothetical protein